MSAKFAFRLFFCLLIFPLLLSACRGAQGAQPSAQPESVVQDFYAWYLGDRSGPPKNVRESPLISPALLSRLEALAASPDSGSTMNFVCAQDFPESVEVSSTDVSGQQATVKALTSFGTQVTLELVTENGRWLIDNVACR